VNGRSFSTRSAPTSSGNGRCGHFDPFPMPG
jgi:hypothetical protein